MASRVLSFLFFSSVALFAGVPGMAAGQTPRLSETPPPSSAAPAAQPNRHPLKGVILDRLADRMALLVKHEEIPGVMKAMTMVLKVDAATFAAAREGQAIVGQLVRKNDGWWLEDVSPGE